MRLFITGIKGQLGSEIARQASNDHDVIGGDLPDFDITNRSQVAAAFAAHRPALIIHCAAFTNVDGAARDPETAYRINGLGTQNIALACAENNIEMLYISTGEVFDGNATQPYREFDSTHPINPYGYSKLAGEEFTKQLSPRHYIVRTSWLTAKGGRNFAHRIQQLADEHGKLRVVTDEVCEPHLRHRSHPSNFKINRDASIRHLSHRQRRLLLTFRLRQKDSRIDESIPHPHRTDHPRRFPSPSTPPKFIPLANLCGAALGITLRSWEEGLKNFLNG